MSFVYTPKSYYEIEPLLEREAFCINYESPQKETEYIHPPILNDISDKIQLEDIPPIKFIIDHDPEVHHCRCGKWWVIEDRCTIGGAACPSCKMDMCPFQDFSGLPPDWRFGNYGSIKNFDIKRKP